MIDSTLTQEQIEALNREWKAFQDEHGKEIKEAITKDFGAYGEHCAQMEMEWMLKFYKSLPNLSKNYK